MEEALQEKPARSLSDHWVVLRHRRWQAVGVTTLVWLLVVAASWVLPPRYRSETLILAERQSVPAQLVPPNISADPQDYVQSLSQQIFSRSRLLRLMDQHNLYQDLQDPEARVDRMRKDIALEAVKPAGGRGDNPALTAFTLSASAANPRLAQQVVVQLTSFLIEDSLQRQQQLSETTTDFLQDQLKQAAKNLTDQEQQLKDFRSRALGELPEQLQSNMQILAGLQSHLQASDDALNRAEQQKVYLTSMLGQYQAAGVRGGETGGSSSAIPLTLDLQLKKLRDQLAETSARYTQNHPDVVRLKQQIAAMDKLKEQFAGQNKSDNVAPSDTTAAGFQAMKPMLELESQLRATNLEISNRKSEIANLEGKIQSYQGRLNLTPIREQELTAVTRNYDQARTNYQSLLAKAEQSELATNLQRQQQQDQFRVLDPPRLPLRPYFPNRLIFCLAGIGAGLVAGLAVALGLEALNPRVYREEDLSEDASAPVLATVPPLPTPEELRTHVWFRRAEWLAAALIVVTVSAVTVFTFLRG